VDSEYQTEIFRKGARFAARGGESVRSVARGEVRFAGWFRGYGQIVIVDHGDGYFTVSGHLSEIFVSVGDVLGEGDTLGTVGETGSLTGPALYFEIRAGGEPLDPAEWLGGSSGRG
jgi:septal ring factor EnvC (AmiA/AmiB activator)